jgi:hypothetical protein
LPVNLSNSLSHLLFLPNLFLKTSGLRNMAILVPMMIADKTKAICKNRGKDIPCKKP